MGRVFDALKRANATQNTGRTEPPQKRNTHRSSGNQDSLTTAREVEEQLFSASSILTMGRNDVAEISASTAHTANAPDGSALSGGFASRAAGATLDAAEATRAIGFVSYDISEARVEPHLVAVCQPRSGYCEQFRSLRTRLLHAGDQKRVFVITSAGAGEGKTLTSINLAWLLAQTEGVRALLIDSDLRQPCATEYLGIDTPSGLSEVLGGEAKLEDAIVRLNPSGLHLLPGGRPRDDVAELLSGPTFARVIAQARRMFDYIIIDAPPLGIFTDANLLISRSDGALLVVRSGKTRYSTVDRLLDQLPPEQLLGIVLNRVEEMFEANAYYYRHRYYQRKKSEEALELLTDAKAKEEVISIT